MTEEQPTEEFKPHTPGYIKEMTEGERVEHMTELGAKGNAAQTEHAQQRETARLATSARDEEIRVKQAAIQVAKPKV